MVRALRLVTILMFVALVSSAYAIWRALAISGGLFVPVPIATVSGPTIRSPLPVLSQVRVHYCDGTTAYTLLALPPDATFTMDAAAGSARTPVGTATAPIPVTGLNGHTPTAPATARQHRLGMLTSAACAEAGTMDDRKFVLCRGQGTAHLTITVRTAAGSQPFSVALPACATFSKAASTLTP